MKRKKILVALAAVAVGLPLIAGCSEPSSTGGETAGTSGPLTIGVAFDQMNEVRQLEFAAIEKVANAENAKLVQQSSNFDAATQASQIQTMIDVNGVNALIVIPVDADQIDASITYANSKNVPVVILDRPLSNTDNIAYQVTGDPIAEGKQAAEAVLASGKAEKVIEIMGSLTDNNAVGRRDGFTAGLEGQKATLLQQVPADWDTTKALDGVANALQTYPHATTIYLHSDYYIASVLSALKEAGRLQPQGKDGHVRIVSIDGDADACAALKDGTVEAVVVNDVKQFGTAAITAAIAIARGETLAAKEEKIPAFVVTSSDIATKESEVWGCQIKNS
nr:sugar ABC transporter substrate-binding protein [Propionicimonas sp.]